GDDPVNVCSEWAPDGERRTGRGLDLGPDPGTEPVPDATSSTSIRRALGLAAGCLVYGGHLAHGANSIQAGLWLAAAWAVLMAAAALVGGSRLPRSTRAPTAAFVALL